jgi:hypothetical protein
MDQYTIYIVVSFICIALACCFCRDDEDGIDIRFRDDTNIIDEEIHESCSDIMIEIDNDDDNRFSNNGEGIKVDDGRFSEFYDNRDDVGGYSEI